MKPYYESEHGAIYQGHVLPILRSRPAESVNMCVTSPPYWGLRDYKIPPQIWDDPGDCPGHEWENKLPAAKESHTNEGFAEYNKKKYRGGGHKAAAQAEDRPDNSGQFCLHCNAWRGSLGLEPTPELYVKHIVDIFREVRRVLRKDGTCWVNLGDCYAHSGACGGESPDGPRRPRATDKEAQEKMKYRIPNGLKPKDLIGIPWRVAFALQADGWYLRSDIIWHKPNPMPESVTDRPTKSHEYLFLLSKSAKYFYDAEAIKEDGPTYIRKASGYSSDEYLSSHPLGKQRNFSKKDVITNGRNKRSVWTIATEPTPEAHFATYPRKLVEPCILAGTSEKGYCAECGSPWVRVVEKTKYTPPSAEPGERFVDKSRGDKNRKLSGKDYNDQVTSKTISWQPTCKCGKAPVPGVVLDPFLGSGTTAMVAYKHERKFIGIEISETYLKEIAIPRIDKKTKQQRLF